MNNQRTNCLHLILPDTDDISINQIGDKYLLTIKEQEPLWKQIIKHIFGIE